LTPYVVALTYAVVGAAVVPIGFAVFRTQYQFVDVALGAIAGAAFSLIPTVGGPASLAATIGVLYWRMRRDLFPDIVVSVAVARLAMVPVLILLVHK
jgi:hypothetical protein